MSNILVTRSSMPTFEEYCEEIKDLWDSHWLTNMGAKHQQLQAELVSAKKELFNLRFQNATNQLNNTARIKEVRKNIARIQTVLTQKAHE